LLLLLDEPSIGLAPTIVDEMQRIVADLSAQGLTVVIGEQSVHWVLPIAHRAYAIAAGRIVAEGPPASLSDADALAARYLGDQPLAQAEGAL
jgi:branched-chain amino acid transport system ATP-binding protein